MRLQFTYPSGWVVDRHVTSTAEAQRLMRDLRTLETGLRGTGRDRDRVLADAYREFMSGRLLDAYLVLACQEQAAEVAS